MHINFLVDIIDHLPDVFGGTDTRDGEDVGLLVSQKLSKLDERVVVVVVGKVGEVFFVEDVDLLLECYENKGSCFEFELKLMEGSMMHCNLECDGGVCGWSVSCVD